MPMFTSTHPRSRTHRLRLGFGLGLGLGLGLGASACARERADTCAPADHPLEAVVIHLQAGEQLNLDAEGFALPTVVRVVQLSGELGLRDPDFAAVWADPAAALGDEFLAVSELEIYPGTHERLAIEPDPQARPHQRRIRRHPARPPAVHLQEPDRRQEDDPGLAQRVDGLADDAGKHPHRGQHANRRDGNEQREGRERAAEVERARRARCEPSAHAAHAGPSG